MPLLFCGMALSNVHAGAARHARATRSASRCCSSWRRWLKFGHIPDGYSVNIHPVVFAAWFGMLATAWNLLPFGQLDGGHLTYATLGDRSSYFSLATVAASIVMCFITYSWVVMTLMMVAMLFLLGPRHPRVIDEYEPLGARAGSPWRCSRS